MIHIFVCWLWLAKLLLVISCVSSLSFNRLNAVEFSRPTSHFWRSWMHVGRLCLARYFLNHHGINNRWVSLLLLLTHVVRWNYLINLCDLWLIVKLTRQIFDFLPIFENLIPNCSPTWVYIVAAYDIAWQLRARSYNFSQPHVRTFKLNHL